MIREEFLRTYHANEPRLFRSFLDKEISIEEYRVQRFVKPLLIVDSSDLESARIIAAQMNNEYMRRCNEEVPLFADSRAALEAMAKRGMPLVLVTNGPSDGQRAKLKQLDIESFFTAILVSSEIGFAKPSAEIFQMAAESLGVSPPELLMIGDSVRDDYHGALQAGCQAILLDRKSLVTDTSIQTMSSLVDLGTKVSRGGN
jgi:HAD superfamily hydrolase (TIGR01549 family)